jgi:hypothetical protein
MVMDGYGWLWMVMDGYGWLLIFPTDDDEIIVNNCLFYQRRQ